MIQKCITFIFIFSACVTAAVAAPVPPDRAASVSNHKSSNSSLYLSEANLELEHAFDSIFQTIIPALPRAVHAMESSRSVFKPGLMDRYQEILISDDVIAGTTLSGHTYSVTTLDVSGRGASIQFAQDSEPTFRLTLQKHGTGEDTSFEFALQYLQNDAYTVKMSVSDAGFLENGYRVGVLDIRFNNRRVIENIWPGKTDFASIASLAKALSVANVSKQDSMRLASLDNYFYLIASNTRLAKNPWLLLQEAGANWPTASKDAIGARRFSTFPRGSRQQNWIISGPEATDVLGFGKSDPVFHGPVATQPDRQPSKLFGHDGHVDGDEAAWCGVGTLGANVVFSPAGSFAYALLCTDIASHS